MLELIKAVSTDIREKKDGTKKKKETFILMIEDNEQTIWKKIYTNSSAFAKKYDFLKDAMESYYNGECTEEDVKELIINQ